MSTLRVDNLTDVAGNPSNYGISGTARAWINFNGTGIVAIRGSYNISSLTDNGVGLYTLAFTTALTDANYSVVGVGVLDTTSGRSPRTVVALSYSAGSCQVNSVSTAASEDQLYCNVAIFR